MEHAVAFATLGVSAGATPEQIRAAYRRRAFETHPDRTAAGAAAFQAVAEAYRTLSEPAALVAPDASSAPGAGPSSRVPATDAAKVLFEYLSDLASEMILNGATAQAVVSFLAREGCPESVARSLEQDLRTRVWPPAVPAEPTEPPSAQVGGPATPGEPAGPAPRPRARRATSARWPALGLAMAALTACALLAWRTAAAPRTPSPSRSTSATGSDPQASIAAPSAADAASPGATAPSQGAPKRSPPARPRSREAPAPVPRRSARADEVSSLGSLSAALDAERDALQADRDRLAAEAAELEREQRAIDAAQAAPGAESDPAQAASLRRREAAYNARLEAARRTEKALLRRARDLNAKIQEYNARVLRSRG